MRWKKYRFFNIIMILCELIIDLFIFLFLLNFHHEPITVWLISVDRIFLHRFGTPGIVSAYPMNIQVDVKVNEIAFW